jgi:hypothetical protein
MVHFYLLFFLYKIINIRYIAFTSLYKKKLNKSEPYSCRRTPFHAGVYIYLVTTAGVFKYGRFVQVLSNASAKWLRLHLKIYRNKRNNFQASWFLVICQSVCKRRGLCYFSGSRNHFALAFDNTCTKRPYLNTPAVVTR